MSGELMLFEHWEGFYSVERGALWTRWGGASVEGPAHDMRGLSKAIRSGGEYHSKKCAIVMHKEHADIWSPRNSARIGRLTAAEALELADAIDVVLGGEG